MTCFCPLDAWPAAPGASRKGIVFSPAKSYAGANALQIPCGQCMGCRLAKAQEWATRITHEASCHEENSFVTLTYSDLWLPSDLSVRVRVLQLFIKRLRQLLDPLGVKIRYYGCGEYGGKSNRPHYHLIIFGYGFPDRYLWRRSASGDYLYRSPLLEKAWPFGHVEIGGVTVQSGGYVARYVTKKIGGDPAAEHYRRFNSETGETWQVDPEFALMSSRPGIGRNWYEKFKGDAFPSDFVTIDGQKRPVPRYYTKQLERESELQLLALKQDRKAAARKHADNNTDARLLVREEVQLDKAKRLVREMENEP